MKKISQLLRAITHPAHRIREKRVVIDLHQLPGADSSVVAMPYQHSSRYTDHAIADAARKLWCQAQHF